MMVGRNLVSILDVGGLEVLRRLGRVCTLCTVRLSVPNYLPRDCVRKFGPNQQMG
jgi:hypothetical protein